MTPIKTYSRHRCGRHHSTYRELAQCMWRREPDQVSGDGGYAVVARCGALTIQLHATAKQAHAALNLINSTGCGAGCRNAHEVIRIVDPALARPWEDAGEHIPPEPPQVSGPPFSGALSIVERTA